ncbi:hypothetical protein WA026_007943 [Henosepilachna vigintioctopunctata]|uniref:Uncharacterized protein n=1 Tax=Henosepilachna vigintioctopunctata TaxID=420089 RepID=A0AAW1TQN5_9CUCU
MPAKNTGGIFSKKARHVLRSSSDLRKERCEPRVVALARLRNSSCLADLEARALKQASSRQVTIRVLLEHPNRRPRCDLWGCCLPHAQQTSNLHLSRTLRKMIYRH